MPPAHASAPRDLARTLLAVLVLGLLAGASLWVVRPFLPALIWATMLVVASWPLLLRVQALLRGSRAAAVALMTLGVFVLFAIPILLGIVTIVEKAPELIAWSQKAPELAAGPPPAWLEDVPLVGARLAERWERIGALSRGELADRIRPYLAPTVRWFVGQVGSLGLVFVHVLLTGILTAILFARGESAAGGLAAFARRLAGARGEHLLDLAGKAVRGVALGVVGTALAQSALGGLGVAVAGIPHAGMLAAVMFLCCVAQIGPVPVLLGCIAWLYWGGSAPAAAGLFVWTLLVGTMDNVLRPILIRRGADLPLLLVFAGVLGGLIGFGIIGLFIGPMLLAVTWTLLADWVNETRAVGEGPP